MSLKGGGDSPAALRAFCVVCGRRFPGSSWDPMPEGWRWDDGVSLACSDACVDRKDVVKAQALVHETERRRRLDR